MPKALCMTGMAIALLVLVLFVLDLALKWPFQRASWPMDLAFVCCATGLGYLSWATLREQD